MEMLFQMTAALLAAGMVIFGSARYAARRALRARIAERCARVIDSSYR